jgi:kumamolisin
MSCPKKFAAIFLGLSIIVQFAAISPAATTTSPQALDGSVNAVADAPTTGTLNPHVAWITRRTLKANELSAKIDFEVALKMRNFAEFQARVNKGERVSVQEKAAKYDPLTSDYQATLDWLVGQGFEIIQQDDDNHLVIFARGTVSQIQAAMGVTFARVQLEGKEYSSAITEPSVPSSLAPLLIGINGLQPHIRMHKHSLLKPNSLTGTNPPYLPQQIAQAYNANGLYSSNLTGSGQTIAIVIDTIPSTTDLQSFWSTYGIQQYLSNMQFVQVVPEIGAAFTAESLLETSIDVEWSSSIAPGAKVRVYATASLASSSLDMAYSRILSDATNNPGLGLHQMSMSYGGGEVVIGQSQINTDDQLFLNLVNAGVTPFASSGDNGSTNGSSSLQVESPASDPNVTGVGGTSLVLDSNGNESSEVVWNDSSGATGGGASTFFTSNSKTISNGTSTASWTWQTGTGVSGNARLVPDVALTADLSEGGALFLDGTNEVEIGGTSWASPVTAAFFALINQARGDVGQSVIGAANPLIYPLLGTANFRDITSGNNVLSGSSSEAGTTNGVPNYTAGVGYDETTGIGVPVVQTLAQTLIGSSSLLGIQSQPPFQNLQPGQTAAISVTASGSPTYQWQRMPAGSTTWSNLTNTSPYNGVTTATLTISGVTTAMTGDQFQCVVTFPGSSTLTTSTSVLAVETPLVVKTIAGTALTQGSANGTGTTGTTFSYPSGVALDNSGDLFVADTNNNVIREISPTGVVTTPYTGFTLPNTIAWDKVNSILYVADSGKNNRIAKISGGTISTFSSFTFKNPQGVAVDGSGNVYVADSGHDTIVKITPSGTASVFAGKSGTSGYVNATGTSARFNNPLGVAVDSSGNVYVADFGNYVVRKINSSRVVTTLAGTPNVGGYLDGVGTSALFNSAAGVSVDGSGNVYVSDAVIPLNGSGSPDSPAAGNNLLRKVTPAGIVTTVAGDPGITGSNDGTGSGAQFFSPQNSFVSSDGEIFIADVYNQTIRAAGLPPVITGQPVGQVVTVGQPATFAVVASGAGFAEGSFTYQWQKNGANISGATNSTYTIASTAGTDTGAYSVVVTSPFGNVTSNSASLVVVTSQPVSQSVTSGSSVTFTIVPPTTGAPFSYQWLFNGSMIPGATNASFTISNVSSSNAGNYSVTITDAYGTVTTTSVSLTVNPVTSTDTPTMPEWALILLAGLLFAMGLPRCPVKFAYGTSK